MLPINIRNVKGLYVSVVEIDLAAFAIDQPIIDLFAGEHQSTLQRRIYVAYCLSNRIIREGRLLAAIYKRLRCQKFPHHVREEDAGKVAPFFFRLSTWNILISHGLELLQRPILRLWALIEYLMIRHNASLRQVE